jgi:hypothetical protein
VIKDFSKVPAKAFLFGGGAVSFADSDGDNYPIKMVARSAQPVDHWFWGRIVHDMAGVTIHKDRIPVDYIHAEEIGYLNKFSTGPAGLLVEGALVPTDEPSDPARKLIARSKGGVPYEASINWAGDGSILEQVQEGFTAEVNGYQFEGPGVIVRAWPLRGVAVCPYGADMNTESQFGESDQTFSVNIRGANEVLRINTLDQKPEPLSEPVDPEREKFLSDLREALRADKLKAESPSPEPVRERKGFASNIRIYRSGLKPLAKKPADLPEETGESKPVGGMASKIRINRSGLKPFGKK